MLPNTYPRGVSPTPRINVPQIPVKIPTLPLINTIAGNATASGLIKSDAQVVDVNSSNNVFTERPPSVRGARNVTFDTSGTSGNSVDSNSLDSLSQTGTGSYRPPSSRDQSRPPSARTQRPPSARVQRPPSARTASPISRTTLPTSNKNSSENIPQSPKLTQSPKLMGSKIDSSQKNIDSLLDDYGYTPVSRVVVQDPSGTKVKYIKASDRNGYYVFIENDTDKNVFVQPQDLTMVEVSQASVIPTSTKMGSYKTAGLDVSGVAFECPDGLCTLKREGSSTIPKETFFTYTSKHVDSVGVVGTSSIGYPIFRLSEIISNPNLVLQNTNMVTKRIRTAAYENVLAEYTSLETSIKEFNSAASAFDKKQNKIYKSLSESIAFLEKTNNNYIRNPSTTETNKTNHRKVISNLRKRHELSMEFFHDIKKVADLRGTINTATKEIIEMNNHVDREFRNIDSVFPE